MANAQMFIWSIAFLLVVGCMNRQPNIALGASADRQEDRSVDMSPDDSLEDFPGNDTSSEELTKDTSPEDLRKDDSSEEDKRNARSVSGPMSFHSELEDYMPLASHLGLPARRLSSRRKRRSGVVIRGPFYPYPRPGHPLRFTSGASDVMPSSWLPVILSSALTLNLVVFWKT